MLALADHWEAKAELRAAQQALQRYADVPRPRPVAPVALAAPDSARATARAKEAIARPWGTLMRQVETRTPPSVAVLSLNAEGGTSGPGRLRLVGEARSMDDVLAYVEALRAAAPVRRAELSHHEAREAEGVALLRFSIDMDWGGGAP